MRGTNSRRLGTRIHVARGSVVVNDVALDAGDAVAIDVGAIEIAGKSGGEVLLFDLP